MAMRRLGRGHRRDPRGPASFQPAERRHRCFLVCWRSLVPKRRSMSWRVRREWSSCSGPDGGLRPEACDGLGRGDRRDVADGVEAGVFPRSDLVDRHRVRRPTQPIDERLNRPRSRENRRAAANWEGRRSTRARAGRMGAADGEAPDCGCGRARARRHRRRAPQRLRSGLYRWRTHRMRAEEFAGVLTAISAAETRLTRHPPSDHDAFDSISSTVTVSAVRS